MTGSPRKHFRISCRTADLMNAPKPAARLTVSEQFPVADGIVFDDTLGFSRRQIELLKARKVLFLTRFRDEAGDRWFDGSIIATDIDAARAVAFGRGLGEEVLGELI